MSLKLEVVASRFRGWRSRQFPHGSSRCYIHKALYTLTRRPRPQMPLILPNTAPTLLIRKSAFERVEMTRAQVDEALGLTPDEFRIEGALIAIGPLVGEDTLGDLIERLEAAGLVYYDDFFELSGNWPEWLRLFAMDASV